MKSSLNTINFLEGGNKFQTMDDVQSELRQLGFVDVTGMEYFDPNDENHTGKIIGKINTNAYGSNNGREVVYTQDGRVWLRDLISAPKHEHDLPRITNIKDIETSLKKIGYDTYNSLPDEKRAGNEKLMDFPTGEYVPMSNGEKFVGKADKEIFDPFSIKSNAERRLKEIADIKKKLDEEFKLLDQTIEDVKERIDSGH